MFKNYKMTIYPLTPIHVGTGEMISPGEYFIFDDMIYVINWGCIPSDELGDLRDELIKWIEENPITWVQNVQKNSKLKSLIVKYAQYKCKSTNIVIKEINKRWGKNQSYLEISTLHRTLDRAFIPGSSIKGAIRTALLWYKTGGDIEQDIIKGDLKPYLDNIEKRKKQSDQIVSKWERKILLRNDKIGGNISDDLLMYVKVSDAYLPKSVSTWVLLPKHIGMAEGAQELQDYKEFIMKTNYEKPYSILGSLSIASDDLLKKRGMAGCISAKEILNSCREFYEEVIYEEEDFWKNKKKINEKEAVLKHYENIIKFAEKNKDGALIRLGWGSGINAVGLNLAKPNGNHPPRGINYKYYYSAKTRILVGGYPPGWALMKLERA